MGLATTGALKKLALCCLEIVFSKFYKIILSSLLYILHNIIPSPSCTLNSKHPFLGKVHVLRMKSHEQFLKDVEADIARLNAALGDDEDMEEDDLFEQQQVTPF